jgi:hypothetical protein
MFVYFLSSDDVDFRVNGGWDQPGCPLANATVISSLISGNMTLEGKDLGVCSVLYSSFWHYHQVPLWCRSRKRPFVQKINPSNHVSRNGSSS